MRSRNALVGLLLCVSIYLYADEDNDSFGFVSADVETTLYENPDSSAMAIAAVPRGAPVEFRAHRKTHILIMRYECKSLYDWGFSYVREA